LRKETTLETLLDFMTKLGEQATGPGIVYLVGGACSVLYNIRAQTLDINIKLDPEPAGIFEAIDSIKKNLNLNIELASPDQFVPALPGWKERSVFIKTINGVEFKHFDFYTQALAKIERGHATDLLDLSFYFDKGLVSRDKLILLFEEAKDKFIRYPSLDFETLKSKLLKLTQE